MQSAGGQLIAQTMISPTSLIQLGAELSAADAPTSLAQAAQFNAHV